MNKKDFWINNIGQTLAEIRSFEGFTQQQIAEKLGTSRQYISNMETGKTFTNLNVLINLCEIYDVDPSQLFVVAGVKIASKDSVVNNQIKDFIHIDLEH